MVPKIPVGKTLVLPLLASDADGDVLDFTVTSSNPAILARVRTGCPILKIHVSYAGDPAATPTPSAPIEGDMEFQLFRDVTPATVGSIGGAAQAGFYDNVIFHRVVPGFVIQGGDPAGTGSGSVGFSSIHEFRPELIFTGRGQLAMANSNGGYDRGSQVSDGTGQPTTFITLGSFDPTNASQFFVTVAQPRSLDFKHTIFGQLIRGFDVLDKVVAVPRSASDKPTVSVTMTTVSVSPGRSDATLLLSATAVASGNLTVTARDASGAVATRTIPVYARKDDTNDPPVIRPIPNLLSPIGVAPALPLRAFDLEHDYLLYGIASASGNPKPGTLGVAQITQNFNPLSTAGFQDLALGVAGFNDPLLGAKVTTSNAFAPFDAYRFQTAEIGYGDRAIAATPVTVEAVAAVAATDVVLAEFRDGDPGGGPLDFTAAVTWGDGSAEVLSTATTPTIKIERSTTTPGSFVVKGTHTFARPGVYSIETVIDATLGAVARARSQAVVIATPTSLRATGEAIDNFGALVNNRLVATFHDPTSGVAVRDFTARIDWGDGHSSAGSVVAKGSGDFAVLGTHTYRDPETFGVFVHLSRATPTPASATAWSRISAQQFTAPRHLPPFSVAHLVGQISQASDANGNGIPVITTTGTGASAQTKFALSIVIVNAGDLASKPGRIHFYLSKDETYNATVVGAQAADISLKIGAFPDGNLPSLQPGAGLRYDLVQSNTSTGPLDLRLVPPIGQNGASYFILAHLDYTDPILDLLPVTKDVTFGRINGITVSKGSLTVTEAAGLSHAQTFTVVLKRPPLTDVKIPLTPSETIQVTLDKTQLIFTRQNWNIPQTVTATAVDDTIHENTTTTVITVGPSESTDASWNGMGGGSVFVSVTDNDPA